MSTPSRRDSTSPRSSPQAVSTCEVLLAVIGPRWLTATDEDGRRWLDDPDDIVRLEITAALERNIRVIPILIEGAVMPRGQALPKGLAELARRNALSLRHESFRADADRLLATVEPIQRAPVTPTTPPHKTGQEVAGAGDFLAIIPTAPDDQQRFLQRLADWATEFDHCEFGPPGRGQEPRLRGRRHRFGGSNNFTHAARTLTPATA
jgi:hypothetical protein